jgi:hypothetical protein
MNARTQRWLAWCGPASIVIFFIGFGLIARFLPPPSPSWSAAEIANFYRENHFRILVGITMAAWGGALCTPWVIALGLQMKRIEGDWSPLALTQIGLGVTLPIQFIVPFYFFLVAAFRSGRSDETIQTLNDLGWLPFCGLVFLWFGQCVVVGVAVLGDKRTTPIFPRWAGYVSLWCGVGTLGSELDVFFTDGPLAWNGLIAWWLIVVGYFTWMIALTYVTLQAINNHEKEYAARPLTGVGAA